MITFIYCRPLWQIIVAMAILILCRGCLPKGKNWLNGILTLAYIFFILSITLFNRKGINAEFFPIPFDTLGRARLQPELYREKLMNILLYLPIGLFLPFALPRHPIFCTAILALGLSFAIEFSQLIFSLGCAEADDILCNTLGAAFGALSIYVLLLRQALFRICKRKRSGFQSTTLASSRRHEAE